MVLSILRNHKAHQGRENHLLLKLLYIIGQIFCQKKIHQLKTEFSAHKCTLSIMKQIHFYPIREYPSKNSELESTVPHESANTLQEDLHRQSAVRVFPASDASRLQGPCQGRHQWSKSGPRSSPEAHTTVINTINRNGKEQRGHVLGYIMHYTVFYTTWSS